MLEPSAQGLLLTFAMTMLPGSGTTGAASLPTTCITGCSSGGGGEVDTGQHHPVLFRLRPTGCAVNSSTRTWLSLLLLLLCWMPTMLA